MRRTTVGTFLTLWNTTAQIIVSRHQDRYTVNLKYTCLVKGELLEEQSMAETCDAKDNE